MHLGHVLSFDLNDGPDITRALKDLNRKANCTLCTFYFADCFVKCFLIKLYCLALYGCCLWHLGSQSLQTALNKLMRKVWHLPSRSHVPIVHCVAKTTSILRIIYGRFIKFCNSGLMSNSSFVSQIFRDSHSLAYTFVGHNFMFAYSYLQNSFSFPPCLCLYWHVMIIIIIALYMPLRHRSNVAATSQRFR